MTRTVVFIHGLWMTGLEMGLLRSRVAEARFTARQFQYSSLIQAPVENAADLQKYVQGIESDEIHFVAHSLGGLVVNHLFADFPEQRPGRIVYLGTPLKESAVAEVFHRSQFTRFLLGRSVKDGLLGGHPGVPEGREAGMIAGTKGVGLGMLLTGALEGINDGTVALDETQSGSLKDRIELSCSHMGMLLSQEVATKVTEFLCRGSFRKVA